MKDMLSKKAVMLEPSGIRKFFDIVSEMPEAISLGVGEPDFDTPWRIREEGIYSLEKGRTFYTSNAGLVELRDEICRYLKRKYHLRYRNDEVLVSVGGSEGIDVALRAIINPGDEVIVPQPSFVCYVPCVIMSDGVPVTVELKEENKFKLTREQLEEAVTDKTKAIIMSFPNNPTGAIMTKKDLEPIADFAKEHDLIVISDEIYSELTYGHKHVSIGALPDMKERTIVINGFSKAFAMTGWRLGYAAAPKVIELTESAIFDNIDTIYAFTRKMHANGFAIAMDDFGSGYSSLNMLKDIPIDVLKIDKGFLSEAADNNRRNIIFSSIADMARKLNIKVVVEGVEHLENVRLMKECGCSIAQGYYFAKPMDEESFRNVFKEGRIC